VLAPGLFGATAPLPPLPVASEYGGGEESTSPPPSPREHSDELSAKQAAGRELSILPLPTAPQRIVSAIDSVRSNGARALPVLTRRSGTRPRCPTTRRGRWP
jgi:hypothetical protein